MENYIHMCYRCMTPLRTGSKTCPVCGYIDGTAHAAGELAPGQILHARYLVGCREVKDQYMIRYLGYDCKQGRKIWVDELFPVDFAARRSDRVGVSVRPQAVEAMQKAITATMQTAGRLRDAGKMKGVAMLLDCFTENGTVYMIWEWRAGQFLCSCAVEQRFRGREEEFVAQMATALSQMHEKQIVHGALHPGSILITPEGKPVLVGIGRGILAFTGLEGETNPTEMTRFLAPECRWDGGNACNVQMDVYGLAALTCWLLTEGKFGKDIEKALTTSPCNSMQKEALIDALRKKPNERTQSIIRFYEYFAGEVTVIPRKEQPTVQRKKGKHMVTIGVLLMIMGLLIVLLGLFFPLEKTAQTDQAEKVEQREETGSTPVLPEAPVPDIAEATPALPEKPVPELAEKGKPGAKEGEPFQLPNIVEPQKPDGGNPDKRGAPNWIS